MARMGYVVGEGLGTRSQGKAEPVPIMLLPQGEMVCLVCQPSTWLGVHAANEG